MEIESFNIRQLSEVPDLERNEAWEDRFLQALAGAKLNLLAEDAQRGPDGWPYLMAETSDEASEPAQRVFHWLSSRGIGLAINPRKQYPDYVLTYGMIWNFRETGRFIDRRVNKTAGSVTLQKSREIKIGSPDPKYLPADVRAILREFFRDQGILQPRLLVMDGPEGTDLVFSLESLRNPPAHEHAGIAEAIGWFLPTHYSLIFLSEKDVKGFENV